MIRQRTAAEAWERLVAARFFLALGIGWVVVGGGVAAVTAHSPSELATWTAAYLVLVAGLAQCALGLGQSRLALGRASRWTLVGELVAWNMGSLAVVGGALLRNAAIADTGGTLLVISLIVFATGVRMAPGGWVAATYRLLIVMLAVSVPIGLLLQRGNA